MSEARVGPVLRAGTRAQAVVAAIRSLNDDVEVVDRGAYLRVLAPGRCLVTRAAIEREIGTTFELPGELECIMPSFDGQFRVDDERAEWRAAREENEDA